MEVDHGTVIPGLGIVVYEYSLFDEQAAWFGAGGQLFAGKAVVYGYDGQGEGVDVKQSPAQFTHNKEIHLRFYHSAAEVEAAIMLAEIQRPQMRVNGAVLWQWPQREHLYRDKTR